MRNRHTVFGAQFWRTAVILLGVMGVFLALDAAVLFFVLLLAAPTPYGGLLMFVAVPMAVLLGTTLAWLAWTVVAERR
jgi:hypothetical protein